MESQSSSPPLPALSSSVSSDTTSPPPTPSTASTPPVLPKITLNTPIECTVTPWLRWQLALRNGIPLQRKYKTYTSLLRSYSPYSHNYCKCAKGVGISDDIYFGSSQLFRAFSYRGIEVLRIADDFYDLAMSYFEACHKQNVLYTEILFDINAHTRRGVPVSAIMTGFSRAKAEAEQRFGITSLWILRFMRDITPSLAIELYDACSPWRDQLISGLTIDGEEFPQASQNAFPVPQRDRRPSVVFAALFARARADGLRISAHYEDADARESALQKHNGFWEEDEVQLQRNSVTESMASDDIKQALLHELDKFEMQSKGEAAHIEMVDPVAVAIS